MNPTILAAILSALLVQHGELGSLIQQVQQAMQPTAPVALVVPADGDLQVALNTAVGRPLQLTAGATYTGSFSLPSGTSIDGQGATIRNTTNAPTLQTVVGATGVRLQDLVVEGVTSSNAIVAIGSGIETDPAQLPHDVVLNNVRVRGSPTAGAKRGIAAHGFNITIANSRITDIKLPTQDTQAIWINNGPGPYTITGNLIEGAGENLLVGGDDPRIVGMIPSDILIEGNELSKPLAWRSQTWQVKNLLEIKNGRRVTIRNNRLENTWKGAQSGFAVLFTPRNQYGRAPWTVLEAILFEGNVVRNVGSGIALAGDDDINPSQRTDGVIIRDNLVIVDKALTNNESAAGRFMQIGRAPQNVMIERNTTISNGSSWIYAYTGGAVTTSTGFVVRDNIGFHNSYGLMSAQATTGSATLRLLFPDAVFEGNVLAGAGSKGSLYPAGNLFPTVTEFMAGFRDTIDYRLKDGLPWSGKGRR